MSGVVAALGSGYESQRMVAAVDGASLVDPVFGANEPAHESKQAISP